MEADFRPVQLLWKLRGRITSQGTRVHTRSSSFAVKKLRNRRHTSRQGEISIVCPFFEEGTAQIYGSALAEGWIFYLRVYFGLFYFNACVRVSRNLKKQLRLIPRRPVSYSPPVD